MPSSARGDLVSKDQKSLPGPGVYESPSKMGSGPFFSIKGRIEGPAKDMIPGPGHYEPSESATKYQSPSCKMVRERSSSARNEIISTEKKLMPGPGTYD